MVGDILCTYQRLVEGKQYLVQFKYIIVFVKDEVFYNDVELATVRQGKPCTGDKIPRLIQIQFQSNRKCQCSGFGRFIIYVIADF